MKLPDTLRFKLAALFGRDKLSAEAEEELRSHIELRADDLERSGLPRREAERRARLEFGATGKFREQSLEAAGGTFVESVIGDLRYASRILRKSPGFTIAAVLTLALGIGANAVVFGVMNALVLKPLNVPQPKSLYAIEWGSVNGGMESYPDYLDLRDRNTSFESLAGYDIEEVGVSAGGGDASEAWALTVTGNYFDVLHIRPELGRFFHSADEHGENSAPYIVLANGYWHAHFAGDPSVVGRTVELNKHPYTIIGVAPRGFNGTMIMFTPDFFLPFVDQGQLVGGDPVNNRASRKMFELFGHLKPGVTPAAAAADLNSVAAYLQKTYPKIEPDPSFRLALPNLYGDFMGRPVRAFLACLMALAALILLAACANLGSLFAARATDRSRELALRMALGSSRSRLLRQMFTEALLISLIGGALGVWGSVMLLGAMSTWQPIPRFPLSVAVNPVRLRGGVAADDRERFALRGRAGAASVAHRSLRNCESGICARNGARIHRARSAAGGADRVVRCARYIVARGAARTHAFSAQRFRFRAAWRVARRYGPRHGRLSRRCGACDAEAHDRGGESDSWRGVRGTRRLGSAREWKLA
jgi:hypothetical protein